VLLPKEKLQLLSMTDIPEPLSLKSVPARLASLVLQLAESGGIMINEGPKIPTHYAPRQLAAMIGANRV
jgi:hypothetical protein